MFGYVRPVLNRLSEPDRKAYQSAYCGLCHAMGRRHGWLARFTLNYDFTFLALLHYGGSGSGETTCRRCPAHPFRKPALCLCGEPLEEAADESMILTWHKLSDDVADHGVLTGLPYRLLRGIFRRAYRRAALARPEFDRRVRSELERLNQLEAERSPRLDRVADTFAGILAAAAGSCGGDEARRRAMEQLLYHLGRWVYLTDAWDDLEADRKQGRYNPLDARFEGQALAQRDYVETTMLHSARLAVSAAALIEFGPWQTMIDNVLTCGLPTVQRAVLDGTWKQQKRRKTIHERSL